MKLILLLISFNAFAWESKSFWEGYAGGIKAGCTNIIYGLPLSHGHLIDEKTQLKLMAFDERNQYCEGLYNEALRVSKPWRKNGK